LLDASARLAGEHRLETIELLLLEFGGWIRIAEGDLRGAELLLRECLRRGESGGKPFFSVSAAHLLSIVHRFQHRLDEARRMSSYALSSRSQSASRLFRAIYLIVSGAVHLDAGAHGQAKRELNAALAMLTAAGAAQQAANAHLMLARLLLKQERRTEARRHLRQGFTIGRDRGFRYYAPFTPLELRDLAREAAAGGICREYCAALLEDLSRSGGAQPLRIFCLGGFRVLRHGEPVKDAAWKSVHAKNLVKLLAAQNGGKISRETVSDILWPDASPERHGLHFRVLLHRTRKALAGGAAADPADSPVLQSDGQLSLNPDAVWTDVSAFLEAVRRARDLQRVKGPRTALAAFEEAIALYGGEFLPANDRDDWALPVREQLRRAFLQTLEDAAALTESQGDHGRAHGLYERLFSSDESHDDACRWLMQRLASEGRSSEAVRIYERHERTLRRDLDMEPEERTKKLYRNIIGG
jgi:DNA-binding SARP family transcriptional activator